MFDPYIKLLHCLQYFVSFNLVSRSIWSSFCRDIQYCKVITLIFLPISLPVLIFYGILLNFIVIIFSGWRVLKVQRCHIRRLCIFDLMFSPFTIFVRRCLFSPMEKYPSNSFYAKSTTFLINCYSWLQYDVFNIAL